MVRLHQSDMVACLAGKLSAVSIQLSALRNQLTLDWIFRAIAIGSASELEYHLLLAENLKMIQPKDHAELSRAPDRAETNADRTA